MQDPMSAKLESLSKLFVSRIEKKNRIYLDTSQPGWQNAWTKGAWTTFQRTIPGGVAKPTRLKLGQEVHSFVIGLRTAPQSVFRKNFLDLTSGLTAAPPLYFGHAQKLATILMKYYFCWFFGGGDKNWRREYGFLFDQFKSFYFPLDNTVLRSLACRYPNEPAVKKHIKLWQGGPRLRFDPTGTIPWSKMNSAEHIRFYLCLQDLVEQEVLNAPDAYFNRLHFEMESLWE